MIVRTLANAERASLFGGQEGRVLVKASDGVGHSLVETRIAAGGRASVAPGHLGPVGTHGHYWLDGEGVCLVDGKEHPVGPGTLIATTSRRNVTVVAKTDMRVCSVLCPGAETSEVVVRKLDDIHGTERDVFWGNGYSKRLLVRKDGMGFAFCVTIGHENTDSPLQYRNHYESCYYISGTGEYVWGTGRHEILTDGGGGTVFVMNEHDTHRMVVREESVCLSIFTPPIEGTERHDFTREAASSY